VGGRVSAFICSEALRKASNRERDWGTKTPRGPQCRCKPWECPPCWVRGNHGLSEPTGRWGLHFKDLESHRNCLRPRKADSRNITKPSVSIAAFQVDTHFMLSVLCYNM
jgi:hypothetical protein